MALKLALENVVNLPDGGPVCVTVTGKRGVDIGRDDHLDWTLPDPSRFVSGKHCEIRYEGGAYVLTDVSSNGTFLNDEPHRMREPRRLRHGDRLLIGPYIVTVALDGEPAEPDAPAPALRPRLDADLWDTGEPAPEPIDPRSLRPVPERPKAADFLDWALDVFDPLEGAPKPQRDGGRPAKFEPADWLPPPPAAPAPAQAPDIPAPRRPLWSDGEPPSPPARRQEPPAVAPSSVAPPAAAPVLAADADAGARFLRRFAEAAGLAPEALARRDADALADELGALMKLVTREMKQLLEARIALKRAARASQTVIAGADNNPLKFSPTAQDALTLMFGPPTRSYLPAQAAFAQAFDDLKRHQGAVEAAMREAARRLAEDLDPDRIEAEAAPDGGVAALFGSRKARLWDIFAARARAKAQGHDDGLAGAFMLYFAQIYDRTHTG